MEIKFSKDNRLVLIYCFIIYLCIVCVGTFHEPTIRTKNVSSSRSKAVYERHLESDEKEIFRPAACANVAYANQTYRDVVDPYSLSITELLIELDHPYFATPPNPNGPTLVDIGVHLHSIYNLDAGTNTFDMEGYLDMMWCDPHTKFDATEEGTHQHMYLERDAEHELEDIWWPAIAFKNEKAKRVVENQELIITSDGTVEYREKFFVTLSSKFEMTRFPFDRQILKAEIESFAWNSDQMVFHVEEDLVGFSDEFEIPEQTILKIEEHLETVQEARDRHPFSELMVEIYLQRNPVYYITKVFIPLGLIVGISWAVFWMDPVELADRMAISFTGVLTSAAYQFVVTDILPRHVDNTFLSNFVLVSFVMMILCAVENVVARTLVYRGDPLGAKMLDRVSRVVMPLFFVVVCLVMASAQIMQSDKLTYGGVIAVCVALPLLLIVLTWFLVRRFKIRHPHYKTGDPIDQSFQFSPGVKQPSQRFLNESKRTEAPGDDAEELDSEHSKGNNKVLEDLEQL